MSKPLPEIVHSLNELVASLETVRDMTIMSLSAAEACEQIAFFSRAIGQIKAAKTSLMFANNARRPA